jgi:DNA ligase-1
MSTCEATKKRTAETQQSQQQSKKTKLPFSGMVFCVTGKMTHFTNKREFAKQLLLNGGQVKTSMIGAVTHLICVDTENPGTGSKVQKANASDNCTLVSEQSVVDQMVLFGVDEVLGGSGVAADSSIFPIDDCMLAKSFDNSNGIENSKQKDKVIGWFMSEKLDGLRAIYSGSDLYSRAKNKFHVPAEFMAEWPDLVLDGELCCGRGKFKESISLVKNHNATYERYLADGLVYSVFDAPLLSGNFSERIEKLKVILAGKKHIVVLEQTKIENIEQVKEAFDSVLELNGEGLMLRKADDKYHYKRSATLLKVKQFHDAEATVVAYHAGKGKNEGLCGALVCKMPSGQTFKCGSGMNTEDRKNPPAIGATITYRYFEVTGSGRPRFPTFVRIRADVNM